MCNQCCHLLERMSQTLTVLTETVAQVKLLQARQMADQTRLEDKVDLLEGQMKSVVASVKRLTDRLPPITGVEIVPTLTKEKT